MDIVHIKRRRKMSLLLTDEETAEVQGDKDMCLAVIHGFGGCGGCSANCGKVAKAQLKKVVEWLKERVEFEHESCDESCGHKFVVISVYPWDWQSLVDEVK